VDIVGHGHFLRGRQCPHFRVGLVVVGADALRKGFHIGVARFSLGHFSEPHFGEAILVGVREERFVCMSQIVGTGTSRDEERECGDYAGSDG